MNKQHLCATHAEMVKQNPRKALQLWFGAFNHGVAAFDAERWQEAERFLGIAWEISSLRFALDLATDTPSLGSRELASVARYYANTLCRLQLHDAAERCLRRAHDALLHWSLATHRPYSERKLAFDQLAEFRTRVSALLSLTGRHSYAKCLELMALQLSKRAARNLLH